MADFGDLVLEELARLTSGGRIRDLAGLSRAERAAALPLEERQAIAREAGPVGSRPYRSAMRSLQRYVTGAGELREPSARTLERLRAIRQRLSLRAIAARFAGRPVEATITGMVRVSQDLRRRTVRAIIAPEDFARVLALYLAGQPNETVNAFLDAFIQAYSSVPVQFESAERVRLRPLDAEEAEAA